MTAIEADHHWKRHATVIMPDHLHALFSLTGSLSLSRAIARLKAKTKPSLHAHNLEWQANFFDHRLRPNESLKHVVRYLAQNPVRAGLASTPADYGCLWLGEAEQAWFDEWDVAANPPRPTWTPK